MVFKGIKTFFQEPFSQPLPMPNMEVIVRHNFTEPALSLYPAALPEPRTSGFFGMLLRHRTIPAHLRLQLLNPAYVLLLLWDGHEGLKKSLL